jgi:hypothetical protein
MSAKLQIAKDLALPLDAVTQKLAWLGRTGSGKTYGAKRMVEQMLRAGAQVVILDPVGVWPGLRLGPKAFDVPVLGGLFGDIPLESTAGALIADLVVNHATSMVLDVSQMLDNERTRFAQAFGERFFQRKKAEPGAVHLVIEECQEFIPQNHQHGEERMLHEYQRIAKLGRNFGIGLSLISQRPQEVNKKALNQAECVLAFQMTGPQERKALEYWLSDKGFDGKLSEILPRLAVGAPHVWSPQWLKISRVVQILPIDSLDTSQTPKVGDKSFRQRKLEPIDLKALTAEMASTLERAKADDPKALRARISELEEQLSDAAEAQPALEPDRVEVPAFDGEAFEGMRRRIDQQLDLAASQLVSARAHVEREVGEYREAVLRAHVASPPISPHVPAVTTPKSAERPSISAGTSAHSRPVTNGAAAGLGKCARSILTAIVQHGRPSLTLVQAAIIAGYASDSGGVRNAAGELRSGGLVSGSNDALEPLPAGRGAVADAPKLPRGKALAEFWYAKLGKAEGCILKHVVDRFPKPAALVDAAEACGYAPDSGGVRNAAGKLRTLMLVHGSNAAMVADERLAGK